MTDPTDWPARWREGRIGFHEGRVNAQLQGHWASLALPTGSAILVPLCGKALDLGWLADRGHRVVGCELSPLAADAYFRERGREPTRRRIGAFTCWSDGPLAILEGDFFRLDEELLEAAAGGGRCAGWWDRAALIALPPPLRAAYVAQLARLLPPTACGLLLSYEYPQQEHEGPPFSVEEEEVRARFAPPDWRPAELLARTDQLAEARSRGREVSRAAEALWRLERT